MKSNIIFTRLYPSPCGELLLGSFFDRLCMCDWTVNRRHDAVKSRLRKELNADFREGSSEVIESCTQQFNEYFAGMRQSFDIPLLLAGTEFQQKVWHELMHIPFGTTISYAALAKRMGNIKAIRAVANANASNALPIIVPCHRVIGSNRSLTGFAGGLDAKRFLLNLEAGYRPDASNGLFSSPEITYG